MSPIYKNIRCLFMIFSIFTQLSAMENSHTPTKEALRAEIIACVEQERFDDLQKIFDECERIGDRSEPFDNTYGYLVTYLRDGLKKKVGSQNHDTVLEELFNKLPSDQESTLKVALRMVYSKGNDKDLDKLEFRDLFKGGGIQSYYMLGNNGTPSGSCSIQIDGRSRFGDKLAVILKDLLALIQPVLGTTIGCLHVGNNPITKIPETLGWLQVLRSLQLESINLKVLPKSTESLKYLHELSLKRNPDIQLPSWITQHELPLYLRQIGSYFELKIDQALQLPWNEEEYPRIRITRYG